MAQVQSTTNKHTFTHLTAIDRGRISALLSEGKSQTDIAKAIGCHKSTISREIKRGTVRQMKSDRTVFEAYFPETGQRKYEENRKACGAKYKLVEVSEFIKYAETKILQDEWSPDAISGHARLHGLFDGAIVCTKTLYNYIDAGLVGVKNIDLPMKLRLNTKKKRCRKNKRILGRSIEERPPEVEERKEFGHWEIDTVIGKKSNDEALMTLTERKTRKELIFKVDGKNKEAIGVAIACLQESYGPLFPNVFKTVTADNGSEFTDLATLIEGEGTAVYYTHPYTSCERGTNERHNGLIRRFIPKGKLISTVADSTIAHVEYWCNQLPRKILGYKTPEECFLEELSLSA